MGLIPTGSASCSTSGLTRSAGSASTTTSRWLATIGARRSCGAVRAGDGVRITKDTFTLGSPHTNGIGTITGSGKCAGGTGVHQREKCTYTFRGTANISPKGVMGRLLGP
jgi:hypothetical protein